MFEIAFRQHNGGRAAVARDSLRTIFLSLIDYLAQASLGILELPISLNARIPPSIN